MDPVCEKRNFAMAKTTVAIGVTSKRVISMNVQAPPNQDFALTIVSIEKSVTNVHAIRVSKSATEIDMRAKTLTNVSIVRVVKSVRIQSAAITVRVPMVMR